MIPRSVPVTSESAPGRCRQVACSGDPPHPGKKCFAGRARGPPIHERVPCRREDHVADPARAGVPCSVLLTREIFASRDDFHLTLPRA